MADAAPVDAGRLARWAEAALRGGEPLVGAVLLPAGRRMAVWADRAEGSLGDPALDAAVAALSRRLLAGEGRAGPRRVEAGGASREVYLEAYRPPPELLIAGAGHIARPLCRIGAMLGFRVVVLDDRPEFATRERFPEAERVLRVDLAAPFREALLRPDSHLVLVTRGHRYDYELLRAALRVPAQPAYIGMVGSRRRVRAALGQLADEGIPPARLAAIHAPIGLDVGAETPEEIAVAIAAEIVLVRRGGTGTPLRDRERVVERWIGGPARETG